MVGAWLLAGVVAAPAWAGETVRVSLGNSGNEANGESEGHPFGGVNTQGTIVAFTSSADDLVAGDTNGQDDLFVRDLKQGATTRVSVATDGSQANGFSGLGTISGNGRYVAFVSEATNLVAGDTNVSRDVFFHDRTTGETARVSVNSAGIQGDADSGGSGFLSISGNGHAVAFNSSATNLVADDTNAADDVFVHVIKTGETTRVSLASDGSEGNDTSLQPSSNANGKVIAFASIATNLVAGDTNGKVDIFVRDVTKGTTVRASIASDGSESNGNSGQPAISANGKVVAFVSNASSLVAADTNAVVDAFVHDLKTGATTCVSVASDGTLANGGSGAVAISANGRFVIFESDASNLVPADTNGAKDVFVHDRKTGQTVRVNLDGAGVQSTGNIGFDLGLSKNGRFAFFSSDAPALVVGDNNTVADVFRHDLK